MSKNKTRTKDKYRVVYNDTQRIELENEFRLNEYIAIPRKQEIAQKLQLSERQIKIWFQNRRAKKRKQLKRRVANTSNTANTSPSSINTSGAISATLTSNAQSNSSTPSSIKCEPPWPNSMHPIAAADHSAPHQQHRTLTQDQLSQATVIGPQLQAQVDAGGCHTLHHPQQQTQQQQQISSFQQQQHQHRPLNVNRYQHPQVAQLTDQEIHHQHQQQQQQHQQQQAQQHLLTRPTIQQQHQQSSIMSNHHIPLTTSPPHHPLSHVQPSHSPYNNPPTQPGFLNDIGEQQPTAQQINAAGHIHSNHHHQQQQQYAAQQQQPAQHQHMMYCNPQHHHNQMLQVGLATHHAWRFHATTPQQHQDIHPHVSPPMQNGTPSPQQIHQHPQKVQSPSFVSQLPHQQQQQVAAAAAQMQHQHYWYQQHQHHHTSNYVPMGNSPMHEIVETL